MLGEDRPYSLGSGDGFPASEPPDEELAPFYRPLDGYRLAPPRAKSRDLGADLMIGFRALRRGFFPVAGLELIYVQDGRQVVARSPAVVGVCVLSDEDYARDLTAEDDQELCRSTEGYTPSSYPLDESVIDGG